VAFAAFIGRRVTSIGNRPDLGTAADVPSTMEPIGREIEARRFQGAAVPRINGQLFVTGGAHYIDDIALPEMLHLAVVRSPHPHATILRIDCEDALADSPVVTVITGEQARRVTDPIPHHIDPRLFGGVHAEVRCLAVDKVVYAGEPVAAVVARSWRDAAEAARRVAVAYAPLPHVLDGDLAARPEAPRIHPTWPSNVLMEGHVADGDVVEALHAADHVLEQEFRIQRYTTAPLEPRGYVGAWNASTQRLTFYAATQNPHPLRWMLSRTLRLAENQIRVIAPNLGGAFGLKMPGHREETLVALASLRLGVPVKWIEDRRECFLIGGREQVHRVRIGFTRDGVITCLQDSMVANIGAVTAAPSWTMARRTAGTLPSGYRVRHLDVHYRLVVTNKSPWTASRGYGKEAANLVMERLLDLVARRLKLDPVEVRYRNFVRRDEFPYATASGLNLDSGDYHGVLEKACALIDYPALRSTQAALRARGRCIGIGVAFELTPEGGGIPGTLVGDYDTSTVRMDPSGKVSVLTGVTTPGGGNDTGIAQVVATELGVALGDVTVVQGDTDVCPYGFGNYSGRGMLYGGTAALLAARDLKAKLAAMTAAMLGTDQVGLVFDRGTVFHRSDDRRALPVRDVARAIYAQATAAEPAIAPPLEATRVYTPGNIRQTPDARGRVQPYPTYSNGAYIAVVDVDVDTGRVTVTDFAIAHDCGTVVNTALVEGQVRGGAAMGIGAALTEVLTHDVHGRLLTDRFKTYLLPRASDVPPFKMAHQITPSPFTVLGTKGAGEAGVGGGLAAVANAVEDALSAFGVTVAEFPMDPPRVLRLLDAARRPE
jgi:carbon-monoxide dehydrogenase large subunit